MNDPSHRYVALSGGVGGAKLSLGLAHVLADRLSLIVNTGDDFEHLGLHVSPDLDTALYTLAGLVNLGHRLGTERRDLDLHGARSRGSVVRAGSGWATAILPRMCCARRASRAARR